MGFLVHNQKLTLLFEIQYPSRIGKCLKGVNQNQGFLFFKLENPFSELWLLHYSISNKTNSEKKNRSHLSINFCLSLIFIYLLIYFYRNKHHYTSEKYCLCYGGMGVKSNKLIENKLK